MTETPSLPPDTPEPPAALTPLPGAALMRWQRQVYVSQVDARVRSALSTPAPFVERMVHFWSNHFAVSIDRRPQAALAATLESEAIRPHVLGRFEDLLLAVVRHPAMLLYLDQPRSIGPNSDAARRAAARGRREFGLNENLAREILELHTLGVQGGYGQDDVQELARALTGWTIAGFGPGAPAGDGADPRTAFVDALHEPGPRTLLGRRYAEGGAQQAETMLVDLARHPATAHHLAGKLARHWIDDAPSAETVDAIAAVYRRSDGDLPTTFAAVVDARAAWQTPLAKFKTPWEFVVSAMRAAGVSATGTRPEALAGSLAALGQRTWQPGSPAGWPDTAERWAAPDALMKRVDWAAAFAQRAGTLDARQVAQAALPGVLGTATREEIARAETPAQAMTLLLASPEFLRR